MPSPGQQFGHYRLIDKIGDGGMATVYLADDVKHGRRVAIKFVGSSGAVPLDRFQREIDIAARLTHPHIVPLYDSGVVDGSPFYVMPYIEGESLRDRLRREGRLPLEATRRLVREIASALDHAHARGLVHRDIKPENVLLSHGIALVADFGVARPVRGDVAAETQLESRLTGVGLVIGTPSYMAPEQALGSPDVDGRADIYALGCVAFEMLAGHPPFSGPTTAVLMRHLIDPVPSLMQLLPELPDGVAGAIERALAKSAPDRFSRALDFADALDGTTLEPSGRAASAERPAARPAVTVAVLPFQEIGGGDQADYLSEGICDELILALGRLKGVRVIARGSSFQFRETRPDVRTIGERLQVSFLVDGTVRRSGKRLRLTAQLVSAADGFQVWSERYDRELDDVFALEDELAGSIAAVLGDRLTGRREAIAPQAARSAPSSSALTGPGDRPTTEASGVIAGPPAPRNAAAPAHPTSVAVYERYLMGLQHWNRRTPPALDRAVEHFASAVQGDPGFTPAWGAMALCYVTQHIYGLRRPDELITLTRAAVEQALRADPRHVAALTARACLRSVFDWDFAAAELDFRRCLELDPSNATGHQWYAMNLLAPRGRFEEARAELEAARVLDPLSPAVLASLGFVSYLQGQHDRSLEEYDRALALDATFPAASYFRGVTLTSAGRLDEATAALEAAAEGMARSPEVVAALGAAWAERGESNRALAVIDELEGRAKERYVSPALLAVVRLALGDRDLALTGLERAVEMRAIEVLWLDVRPTFAPLRSDPRFQGLLARRTARLRVAVE